MSEASKKKSQENNSKVFYDGNKEIKVKLDKTADKNIDASFGKQHEMPTEMQSQPSMAEDGPAPQQDSGVDENKPQQTVTE